MNRRDSSPKRKPKCLCGCGKEARVYCFQCKEEFHFDCGRINPDHTPRFAGYCTLCTGKMLKSIPFVMPYFNPFASCCYIYQLNILKHKFNLPIPILQCIQSHLK